MALINNLWVQVIDESVSRNVKGTEHPTEKGIALTDCVKREAVTLSIKGKIADYGEVKSHEILAKLYDLANKGSLIEYSGRNLIKNLQIRSFSTTHPYTNAGGLDFTMTLKEVRIAQNSYAANSTDENRGKDKTEEKAGTQQVDKGNEDAVYHTTVSGDTIWNLVNSSYKDIDTSVKWVIENNPEAFGTEGDATTLKVGVKLLIGYKNKTDKNV